MPPGAIFLSASVPDEKRAPQFSATADVVAITSAVNALTQVALGRRRLVWGGHPAITPMIRLIAESMRVDYSQWVHLHQSKYFEAQFPEDNAYFSSITYSEAVAGDQAQSLLVMRKEMFSSRQFDAAVFIGGMGGIVDEFDLFCAAQPDATLVPIYSTGGATLELKSRMNREDAALSDNLDYIALLHAQLGVPNRERRYTTPAYQPADETRRLRRHRTK